MFHQIVHCRRCDSKSEPIIFDSLSAIKLSQIRGADMVTSPLSTHVMARPTPAKAGDLRREFDCRPISHFKTILLETR